MSGGSYNYLCYAQSEELLTDESKQGNLQDMWERLQNLQWEEHAADTENVMRQLQIVKDQLSKLDTMMDKVREIWRAVEWKDSMDGSELFDKIKKEHEQALQLSTAWLLTLERTTHEQVHRC